MDNVEIYMRGADGQFYKEVKQPNGDCDYLPAEKGIVLLELPNGKFVAQRDLNQEAREYLDSSKGHEQFFKNLDASSKGDPKAVKQNLKRQKALERKMNILATDMVLPPQAPNVEFVTDEKFMDLMSVYQKAVLEGCAKECHFQPVATYQQKLITKSGTVIRPLYKGEIGMVDNKTILCLEGGYGMGNSAQVPETLE